jgi:acetylornithine deacetylase
MEKPEQPCQMNKPLDLLYNESIELLQSLVRTPSFSREESATAEILIEFFQAHDIPTERIGNNVIVRHQAFDPSKPTLLLNSHHDTVKPNAGYTRDPFSADREDGKLYGLGSNDAGGCLVSLIAAFLHYYSQSDLSYNLLLAATAEEEVSGTGGVEMILPHLPVIDCALVGEPTKLDLAVAERGLMVLDCVANGKAGHAARNEGINAIDLAMDDIQWFRQHRFERVSDLLGACQMTVTVIETHNKTHNIIPAKCQFVVDVRVNELYSFEQILEEIRMHTRSIITPRGFRLRSTSIPLDHPLVVGGCKQGRKPYGSPTTSDKALMPFPALKTGPGDSARSHSANEYIYTEEIRNGIDHYIHLIDHLQQSHK